MAALAGAARIAVVATAASADAVQIAVVTNIQGPVHVAASGSDRADQKH